MSGEGRWEEGGRVVRESSEGRGEVGGWRVGGDRKMGRERGSEKNGGGGGGKGKKTKTGEVVGNEGIWAKRRVKYKRNGIAKRWRGEEAGKEEYGDKGLIRKQRIVWRVRNAPTHT